MSERLNEWVDRLAASPPDRDLDGLEAQIARRIRLRRRDDRTATLLAPVRVATIGLALAVGVTAGGVTAATATPRAPGAFSAATELAPSTLLEGR
jgi:hypothetical protein